MPEPFRWNLKNKRALQTMIESASRIPPLPMIYRRKPSSKQMAVAQARVFSALERAERFCRQVQSVSENEAYYSEEMLTCCARIIALGAKYDLVFVGRSLESAFDHLCGLFEDTTFASRLTLLQYSYRRHDRGPQWSSQLAALRVYFTTMGLNPQQLSRRARPIAFVDIVHSGATFSGLITLLREWCTEQGLDWAPVRKNIRLIGVVQRKKTSPNTERWQQTSFWRSTLDKRSIKNISISPTLWSYLGDHQNKATQSFYRERWTAKEAARSRHTSERIIGVQNALYWNELGTQAQRREQFAAVLSKQEEMSESALRDIVLSLRNRKNEVSRKDKSGTKKPVPFRP